MAFNLDDAKKIYEKANKIQKEIDAVAGDSDIADELIKWSEGWSKENKDMPKELKTAFDLLHKITKNSFAWSSATAIPQTKPTLLALYAFASSRGFKNTKVQALLQQKPLPDLTAMMKDAAKKAA